MDLPWTSRHLNHLSINTAVGLGGEAVCIALCNVGSLRSDKHLCAWMFGELTAGIYKVWVPSKRTGVYLALWMHSPYMHKPGGEGSSAPSEWEVLVHRDSASLPY